jgi:hypothetical protein
MRRGPFEPTFDPMTEAARCPPPLFRAAPVESRSALKAFPLVRLFESGLDQRRWNAFVRHQNKAGAAGGLMMLEDGRGAAHAVFAWRVKPNMLGERVLSITDAVLGSLPGRALVDALIEEIMSLAHERECQAIEIELPGGSGANPEALLRRGFKLVGGARLLARVASS